MILWLFFILIGKLSFVDLLTTQIIIFLTALFPKSYCNSFFKNFQISTFSNFQIDIYSSFFFLDKKESKNQDWKLA